MQAGAGLSTRDDARSAAIEAAMEARRTVDGRPELAVVFASPHFGPGAESLLDAIHEALAPRHLIGCTAESVLGGTREVEGKPAVSVWTATLPEVETFQVQYEGAPDEGEFRGWPEGKPGPFLVLCDPFTFPADRLLRHMNEKAPRTLLVGGMASGATGPGQSRLFMGRRVVTEGAVGARLGGDVEVRALVSQGCRPVGQTFTVTKAEGNLVLELGGRPPVERIREMYTNASPEDQKLLSQGLLVGRVIDEYKTDFERGDFLVRSVLGADPRSGAIAVGDAVEVGETIQFHVRDASSADEDLRETLGLARSELAGRSPVGALLFTCNGRGSRMFEAPDHDAALVSKELGGLPLAGFFCAGEIGPVGGQNFLHGFTASMALFSEKTGETGG